MTLPIAENIPEIDFGIGELRKHSLLCVFIAEDGVSESERKIRAWLLHAVFSATKHYAKVREFVVLQNNADQARDGGLVLHLLDVSEHLEDCVTGTYRACMAVRRMSENNEACSLFIENNHHAFARLGKVRNQFEHMHSQIVSGETGKGPISVTLSDHGNYLQFRKLKMAVASLFDLLKGLFHVVASMYPGFDVQSKPQAQDSGPMKLRASLSIDVEQKSEQ